MLTAAVLTRENFLAWLSGRGPDQSFRLDGGKLQARIPKGQYAVIWDKDTSFAQHGRAIISLSQSDMQDFFAFVTTYVSGYVPFTAFFRVVPIEVLDDFLESSTNGISKHPDAPSSLIGVALAEAFLRMPGRPSSVDDIPLSAVGATLSSVLAGALGTATGRKSLETIASRWMTVRLWLGDQESSGQLRNVVEIFRAVSGYGGARRDGTEGSISPEQSKAVLNVIANGVISQDDWSLLTSKNQRVEDAYARMRGPREDRTKTFFSSLQVLRSELNADSRGAIECLAGCLLAMVGDGSFQYLPLCREFGDDLAGATLWFGLWASLQKTSDVLTIGNCAGRRVARDVFVAPRAFDMPKDDISFEELQVIGISPSDQPRFRSAQQTSLSVELVPGVSARFRWGKVQPRISDSLPQAVVDLSELQFLLERAGRTVARLTDLLDADNPRRRGDAKNKRKPRG
jgi:hypothetical protein